MLMMKIKYFFVTILLLSTKLLPGRSSYYKYHESQLYKLARAISVSLAGCLCKGPLLSGQLIELGILMSQSIGDEHS